MTDGYVYLRHIADALSRIEQYAPHDKHAFLNDTQCQDAVMRNLAVIGEAAKISTKATRRAFTKKKEDRFSNAR